MVAYSALRQVCAPTAVEHSVSARFTTAHFNELIVARRQVLQVFRVLDDQSRTTNSSSSTSNESFTRTRNTNTSAGNDNDACLELRFECELSGNIESISVVRLPHHHQQQEQQREDNNNSHSHKSRELILPMPGTDALLLTFEEGKASLVAFDPSVGPQRALATLSIFDFEDASLASLASSIGAMSGGLGGSSGSGDLQASRGGLRRFVGYGAKASALVDPFSQCAVMLLYGSQLVVIPFASSIGNNSPSNTDEDCLGVLPIADTTNNLEEKQKAQAVNQQPNPQTADGNAPAVADADTDRKADRANHDQDDDGDDGRDEDGDEDGEGGKARAFVVESSADSTSAIENNKNSLIRPPFLLRLPLRGIPCGSVRDITFLNGYHASTPVVLVLYTTAAKTWTARGVARRHTCSVTAFSLTPNHPSDPANFTALWTQADLPHDSFKVVATPCDAKFDLHTSRALVFSANAVQVVGPNKASCYSMAINGFAPFSVHEHSHPLHDTNGVVDGAGSLKPGPMGERDESRLSLLLSGVRTLWLDRTHCLVATVKSGVMMILTVTSSSTFGAGDVANGSSSNSSGGGGANKNAIVESRWSGVASRVSLRLDVVGTCSPATSICLITQSKDSSNSRNTADGGIGGGGGGGGGRNSVRQYVFVGSREADSMLVEAVRLGEREWERVEVKRLRKEDIPPIGGVELGSEDALLYGSSLNGSLAASHASAAAPDTDPKALLFNNNTNNNDDDEGNTGNDGDNDEKHHEQQHQLKFSLVVRDRLSSCGPITSVTLGASLTPVSELEQLTMDDQGNVSERHAAVEAEAKLLMTQGKYSAAASVRAKAKQEEEASRQRNSSRQVPMDREVLVGAGKGRTAGGVRRISYGLRADIQTQVKLHDVVGTWSLLVAHSDESAIEAAKRAGLAAAAAAAAVEASAAAALAQSTDANGKASGVDATSIKNKVKNTPGKNSNKRASVSRAAATVAVQLREVLLVSTHTNTRVLHVTPNGLDEVPHGFGSLRTNTPTLYAGVVEHVLPPAHVDADTSTDIDLDDSVPSRLVVQVCSDSILLIDLLAEKVKVTEDNNKNKNRNGDKVNASAAAVGLLSLLSVNSIAQSAAEAYKKWNNQKGPSDATKYNQAIEEDDGKDVATSGDTDTKTDDEEVMLIHVAHAGAYLIVSLTNGLHHVLQIQSSQLKGNANDAIHSTHAQLVSAPAHVQAALLCVTLGPRNSFSTSASATATAPVRVIQLISGSTAAPFTRFRQQQHQGGVNKNTDDDEQDDDEDEDTAVREVVCVLARGGITERGAGGLEAFTVPSFNCLFKSSGPIVLGHNRLRNCVRADDVAVSTAGQRPGLSRAISFQSSNDLNSSSGIADYNIRMANRSSAVMSVLASTFAVDIAVAAVGTSVPSTTDADDDDMVREQQAFGSGMRRQTSSQDTGGGGGGVSGGGAAGGSQHDLIPLTPCVVVALNNGDILVYRFRRDCFSEMNIFSSPNSGRNITPNSMEVDDAADIEVDTGGGGGECRPSACLLERAPFALVTRGMRARPGLRDPLADLPVLPGRAKNFRMPLLFPYSSPHSAGVLVASLSPVWVSAHRGQVRVFAFDPGARYPLPLPVQRVRPLALTTVVARSRPETNKSKSSSVRDNTPSETAMDVDVDGITKSTVSDGEEGIVRDENIVSKGKMKTKLPPTAASAAQAPAESIKVPNAMVCGPMVDAVRGAISCASFVQSWPGMFVCFYNAVLPTNTTTNHFLRHGDLERGPMATDNLKAPSLRLCSLPGSHRIGSFVNSNVATASTSAQRRQKLRIELDQAAVHNSAVMRGVLMGGTVTQLTYIHHASRGSMHDANRTVQEPVYAMLVSKERAAVELPSQERVEEAEAEEDMAGGVGVGPDGEKEVDRVELGFLKRKDLFASQAKFGGAPQLTDVQCSIVLCTASTWATGADEFKLLPYERAICVSNVRVRTQQSNVERDLLAVGTGFVFPEGEDRGCRGRVLLFQVIHAEINASTHNTAGTRRGQRPGRPSTRPRLRVITDKVHQSGLRKSEVRGPITAISSLDGRLLVAMGNMPASLRLCHVDERAMSVIPHKFYDTPFCVVSLNVVRDTFLLIGDLMRSVQFIRYHDPNAPPESSNNKDSSKNKYGQHGHHGHHYSQKNLNKEFKLLQRDTQHMRILATNFLIDGGFLGLVATDDLGNLQVLECNGVTSKLQCVADVHLGGRCVAMDRLELACTYNTPTSSSSSKSASSDDSEGLAKTRIGLVLGTLDGEVDVLAPLDEVSFRGLYALQAALIKHEDVHHNAGLNPRAFRLIQAHESLSRARQGNIADGQLLQRFLSMNYVLQRQLARMIGTSADTLVDSLMELELATRWC